MRRFIGSIIVAMLLMVTAAPPAHALSNGLKCTTPSNISGEYSIKLCVNVHSGDSFPGSWTSYRGQMNFCNWYPNDPCEAQKIHIGFIKLMQDICGDGEGWKLVTATVNYSFDPRNFSNTHTNWHDSTKGKWYQTFVEFEVQWLNGAWSNTLARQSQKFYVGGALGEQDCPNLY